MDTRSEIKCTLKELAKIALGTPELTGLNTVILHSLLNLILKKMNCQNEKVTISGCDAMQLENLMKISAPAVLHFDEQISGEPFKIFDKVDPMCSRINEMESKLHEHLSEILAAPEEPTPFALCQTRKPVCKEDIFSVWDPFVCNLCEYLLYGAAAKQFHFRLLQPIMKAYASTKQKLDALELELCKVLQRLNVITRKLIVMNEVMKEVASLQNKLKERNDKFAEALHEIEDILAAKVNIMDIADLMEYIYRRLQKQWAAVNALRDKNQCKHAYLTLLEREAALPPKSQPPLELPYLCRFACDDIVFEASALLRRIKNIDIERVKLQLEVVEQDRKNFSMSN